MGKFCFWTIARWVLVLFTAGTGLILSGTFLGCIYTETSFKPSEPKAETILFGNYRLIFLGYGDVDGTLRIEATFLRPPAYTTGLDTIPVFWIDSVSVQGACERLPSVVIPETYLQQEMEAYRKGMGNGYRREIVRENDLFREHATITPETFFVSFSQARLLECDNRQVEVVLYARLSDPRTGALVKSEVKPLMFTANKYKALRME